MQQLKKIIATLKVIIDIVDSVIGALESKLPHLFSEQKNESNTLTK